MNSIQPTELQSRRRFLGRSAALTVAGVSWPAGGPFAAETVTLPFENGERPLVKCPQKRPLIRLTARPPQLETPFSVFNESLFTPNDAFFVRYHLTNSPPAREALMPDQFRLQVKGRVIPTHSVAAILDYLTSAYGKAVPPR